MTWQHVRGYLRRKALVLVVIANILVLAYVLTQYQPALSARRDLEGLRRELASVRAVHTLDLQQLSTRVSTLEEAIVAEITPELRDKQRPLILTPNWYANRDAELRRRIEALERWRRAWDVTVTTPR